MSGGSAVLEAENARLRAALAEAEHRRDLAWQRAIFGDSNVDNSAWIVEQFGTPETYESYLAEGKKFDGEIESHLIAEVESRVRDEVEREMMLESCWYCANQGSPYRDDVGEWLHGAFICGCSTRWEIRYQRAKEAEGED